MLMVYAEVGDYFPVIVLILNYSNASVWLILKSSNLTRLKQFNQPQNIISTAMHVTV